MTCGGSGHRGRFRLRHQGYNFMVEEFGVTRGFGSASWSSDYSNCISISTNHVSNSDFHMGSLRRGLH